MAYVRKQGGQSNVDFFVVKLNAAGTGYDVYDVFTTPGTPDKVDSITTRASGKPFTLTEFETGKYDWQSDKTLKVEFKNYHSEADFLTLIKTVARTIESSAEFQPYTIENGTTRTGASQYKVLMVAYGAKNTNVTPNEIFVTYAFGSIDATSGSYESSAKNHSTPKFAFVGEKVETAFVIPTALFHSHASDPALGLVDSADVTTLAPTLIKNQCADEVWLPVPVTT